MTFKKKNEIYNYFKNTFDSKKELDNSLLDSLCWKIVDFGYNEFGNDTSFVNRLKKQFFFDGIDSTSNYQEGYCLEILFLRGGSNCYLRTNNFPEKKLSRKQKKENEWQLLEFLKEMSATRNIPFNLIDKFHLEILFQTNENKAFIDFYIKCTGINDMNVIKREISLTK